MNLEFMESGVEKQKDAKFVERFDTGERKASFLDNCLRVNGGGFEVNDGGQKRRLDLDSEGKEKTFGSNNGKLAFVTEGGLYYVTTASADKVFELEAMGYKRKSNLFVPLSNNEVPTNDTDWLQWKKIVEGKK